MWIAACAATHILLGVRAKLTSDLAALRIERTAERQSTRSYLPYAAVIIVVCAGGVLYLSRDRGSVPRVAAVQPIVRTSATDADKAVLTASGYLVARHKAIVSAKIQGRLAELLVDEGSTVAKDQVIARLDNTDVQAQVEVARAQLLRSEVELA